MAKKKYRKKINFDVYNAENDEDEKLIRRRGGGGGELGRTMDKVDSVEFSTEKIDSEDDEDITEDDAFNSSDEERFGLFFSDSVQKKKSTELNLNEDSNSEEDIDEDEMIDISELLNDAKPDEPGESIQKSSLISQPSEFSTDHHSDSDLNSSSSEDYESKDLSSILRSESVSSKRKRINERTEVCEESEFKVGLHGDKKRIQLQDLVNSIETESNFPNLKSQLSMLNKKHASAISKPLAPNMQSKLNRKAAKVETEKSVSKWTQLVKKNREGETLELSYREQDPVNLSSGALIGKFEVNWN
jgi:U3 small nucleolar RNA-associated protein 14